MPGIFATASKGAASRPGGMTRGPSISTQAFMKAMLLASGAFFPTIVSHSSSLSGSVGHFASLAYSVGDHLTLCLPSGGSWWILPNSSRQEGLEPSTESQLSSVQVFVLASFTYVRVM